MICYRAVWSYKYYIRGTNLKILNSTICSEMTWLWISKTLITAVLWNCCIICKSFMTFLEAVLNLANIRKELYDLRWLTWTMSSWNHVKKVALVLTRSCKWLCMEFNNCEAKDATQKVRPGTRSNMYFNCISILIPFRLHSLNIKQ